MKPRTPWSLLIVAICSLVLPATAQEEAPRTVSIAIFEARVRSFAPGIDAIIALTEDQEQKLAAAYNEVFNTTGVRLANMVLQDSNAPLVQRQMAEAAVRQAQAEFQTKSREVFTEEQRELIDKVYAAFTRVFESAQEAMVKQVSEGFTGELEQLLTPEQKEAMANRKAELERAAAEAAEGETEDSPAEGGTE